jgi:1-deoxy-D-xylulose-5-phosphate reductoisomerase
MTQWLSILGATGSIGDSTLDLVAQHPDTLRIYGLSCYSQLDKMAQLILRFQPLVVAVSDEAARSTLLGLLAQHQVGVSPKSLPDIVCGIAGLIEIVQASTITTVVAAIVGAAGVPPVLAAARAGKKILLANKEALVMTGQRLMNLVTQHQAQLLPIDSEHNAIFQCLPATSAQQPISQHHTQVKKLWLTASGGPFRTLPLDQFAQITPAQACKHPNWSMGQKISVDSATMMNKGLEVIEAHYLFQQAPADIDVVIHPQSIIHSMVEYIDGSILAQMSHPDMRIPIAHALAFPERITTQTPPLNFLTLGALEFYAPDPQRFPCLQLAFDALHAGGYAPAILNAANEIAVAAFLAKQVSFIDIPRIVEHTLERMAHLAMDSDDFEALMAIDTQARHITQQHIAQDYVCKP